MSREPFQVLVLPYRATPGGSREYAVFRRSDDFQWQGVAGGGEEGESPLDAAERELLEESGLGSESPLFQLDTRDTVPAQIFAAWSQWPTGTYVIPQYFFAVDCGGRAIRLSEEHTAFCWVPYEQAQRLLRYDSNRTALGELEARLEASDMPGMSWTETVQTERKIAR